MSEPSNRPRIVLGVTSAESLVLLKGLPERLQREGWDVHVVSSPDRRLDALKSANVETHALAMSRDPSPLHDLQALWRWIRLMRSLRPDVALVGTPKAGLIGMLASAIMRVPVRIYHLRGLRLETVHGWRRGIFAALERLSIRLSTTTVAVSPSLKSLVIRLGLGAPQKLVVLGAGSSNGVDTTRFHPSDADPDLRSSLGLHAGLPVIGFVGRVTRDKGGAELAGASAELSRRGVPHQLLVVGPIEGDDAMSAINALASTTPVVHTGQVSDTAPYYALMTVFSLPTLREGFPNVVLEAAASGVLVVTTDATGAVDSVVDGQTGYVSRVGDANSLADAIEQALSDEGKRAKMVAAALDRVNTHFRRDVVQGRLVSFIAEHLRATAGAHVPTPGTIG